MSANPTQSAVELTAAEVEIVLSWANAADFEGKLDAEELPLVDKLAKAISGNPSDHAQVRRSL